MQCFTSDPKNRPIFDPKSKECVDKNTKFGIKGDCQSYRRCYVNKEISPYGKWTEFACESDKHFDQERQECINSNESNCISETTTTTTSTTTTTTSTTTTTTSTTTTTTSTTTTTTSTTITTTTTISTTAITTTSTIIQSGKLNLNILRSFITFILINKKKFNLFFSILEICTEKTCLNGGKCEVTDNSGYSCLCPTGFNGPSCQCC